MGERASVAVRTSYEDLTSVVDVVARRLASADVVVELSPPGRVDLGLVEALARLALVARRSGSRLVVRSGAGAAGLMELMELTGLSCCLGQAERHAEPEEQLRAEEVMDVGDPAR